MGQIPETLTIGAFARAAGVNVETETAVHGK
jgi:hypothetical protein